MTESNNIDYSDMPLDAEEFLEFHATRLLLLLYIASNQGKRQFKGRTKLAKMDFFVRYPRFLEIALLTLSMRGEKVPEFTGGNEAVEATMIRYRYGPWDHKYFNLLAFLIGRGLIEVSSGHADTFKLTILGIETTREIVDDPVFSTIVYRCNTVVEKFAQYTGNQLKEFIYDTFPDEVTGVSKNHPIRPDR